LVRFNFSEIMGKMQGILKAADPNAVLPRVSAHFDIKTPSNKK